MTIRLEGDVVHLEGDCRVEEAETLLRLIHEADGRRLDISQCRHLHGAVAQVVLSYGLEVVGDPDDPFLRAYVAPNFARPVDG